MEIMKVTISEVSQVAPLFNQYRVFYGQESDLDLAASFIKDRVSKSESVIL